MKKKIFALIFIVAILAVCLSGCGGSDYTRLNNMVAQKYSKVNVTVTTTLSGETLTSTFVTEYFGTQSKVEYSVENFALFANDAAPENYKTVSVGSLVVENGKIVRQNGDPVDKSYAQMANVGFKFEKGYFQNATISKTQFSADVTSPAAFVGNSGLQCTDMKVVVKFGSSLQSITVSYVSQNGATVQMNYIFTK